MKPTERTTEQVMENLEQFTASLRVPIERVTVDEDGGMEFDLTEEDGE